jgi:acetyl-CoA acetyltransferase
MSGASRDAFIYGVGSSNFGKQPTTSVYELAWQACQEAFADAGTDRFDAAFVGTALGALGIAQRLLKGLGVVDGPIITVENACASGTTAYHEAYEAIRHGRYNKVLALGVEQMSTRIGGAMPPDPIDPEGRSGIVMLPRYAMMAQRYMAEYGVPMEDIAYVAVKNSHNGALNKRAQRARELTLDEVLGSRLVADPLTLFQSCSISDGAAAAVLGAGRDNPRDIAIKSSALVPGGLWDYRTDRLSGRRSSSTRLRPPSSSPGARSMTSTFSRCMTPSRSARSSPSRRWGSRIPVPGPSWACPDRPRSGAAFR